jgi:non-specific serine/threonine protein kinase
LLEFEGNQEMLLQLLSTVSRAADKSAFISELAESGELFSPLRFTSEEAYTFLREIPMYEECGIMCRMPDWWKKKYNSIKVSVSIGDKQPSHVGLDALLAFSPSLVVDGVTLTRDELEALISQTAGLSLLKGKWVEIDHEKLLAVLEAFDKASSMAGDLTLADAMRMQMGLGAATGLEGSGIVEVTNGQWLRGVMDDLKTHTKRDKIKTGKDFKAILRQYQQSGLDWLATMKSLGFGALLADDMGLGKTVQILALLEFLRKKTETKTLLIIPASLIGNWCNEATRFAPKLRYSVIHAKNTAIDKEAADLFITTYGMAARLEDLKSHTWDLIILDEAQAIKNPATKQARAVKSIPAKFHIAMTGTPVENRLSDLWSIFDFLNAGLLGTAKEFSNYASKIQSGGSYARLRNVINPFIMRRLKTDKSIIKDLPDKVEMKIHATLTKKQVALYTSLVRELEEKLDVLTGIERKGVVLSSIMKFKQICNHPDQYLGQGIYDHTFSGKFGILSELCETIRNKRERVLVFTQFREMCGPLSDYLEVLFDKKGLVLHGGTPVKKRAELVDNFNGAEYVPFMVLSLKAGGVGLNLTGANHVIHFDRWWNPAVENQATDRTFRIGQQKNVLVHKLITAGTVEEKIDAMIEEKLKLSDELIAGSGETWITEMSSKELLKLFRLEA